MTQESYLRYLLQVRSLANHQIALSDKKIQKTLDAAYKDLIKLLELNPHSADVVKLNLQSKKAAIEKLMGKTFTGVKNSTVSSANGTINDVVDMRSRLFDKFAKDKGFNLDWESIFATVPTRALNNVLKRVYSDGFTFSDRVWKLNKYSNQQINGIVSAGIARGESAINVSKELKRFLADSELTPGKIWTTAIKPSSSGRGTINYSALRLARTEINNSYREAMIQSNVLSPVTAGVKWNLSNNHPDQDICNVYAESDLYGLGSGVYPADAVPIDHPNGRCYLTDVLRNPKEWDKAKPTGNFDPSAAKASGAVAKQFKDQYTNMLPTIEKKVSVFKSVDIAMQKPLRENIVKVKDSNIMNTTETETHLSERLAGVEEASKKYFDSLSKEDASIVEKYTTSGYEKLNKLLREKQPLDTEMKKFSDSLSRILEEAPRVEGTTYRSIKVSNTYAFSEKYAVGDIVTNNEFLSSSISPLPRNYNLYGNNANHVILEIKSKSGVYIEPVSAILNELEVLYNKGCKFIVKENKMKKVFGSEYHYITLEEIRPPKR